MMNIIGVIPSRFASTRLLGKPLIDIKGKTMIQRVYEQAMKSKLLSDVIVATDNQLISNEVFKFGGKAVLTSEKHKSGTDRICEVIKKIKCDIIVNIQGDEPLLPPDNIDKAIEPLIKDSSLNVSTLAIKILDIKDVFDENIVKVVFDKDNNALYFSRSVIPYDRDKTESPVYYKHIGLYVYKKEFLMTFKSLEQTNLEKSEKLEQLRILENGYKIKVVLTKKDSFSIDTKNDLIKINKFLNDK